MSQPHSALYHALVGLATLAVLLQGLWAGLFLRHGAGTEGWVDVHMVGAYVAVVLAVAATVVAAVRLRSRTDLVAATAVLTVLLIIETGVGSAVHGGPDWLIAIHVPLALLVMGTAVWLPLKARSPR